jgi:hypothetical protein
MMYLRSFLFGIGTAVAAAVLWILTAFVLPIFLPYLLSRITGGGGAAGASIGSDSIVAAAIVGFAAGFYWKFRRASSALVRR